MTKTTVCIVGLVCVGLASAVFASGKTRPFLTRFGVCTMTDLTEKIENADDAAHVERYFHHEDEAYDADLYCVAKPSIAHLPSYHAIPMRASCYNLRQRKFVYRCRMRVLTFGRWFCDSLSKAISFMSCRQSVYRPAKVGPFSR